MTIPEPQPPEDDDRSWQEYEQWAREQEEEADEH